MKHTHYILFAALATAAPSALAQAVRAPPRDDATLPTPAGLQDLRVVAVHGSVAVVDGSAPQRPARSGEGLSRGAQVRVGDDGAALLALPNGATLTLLPGARLTVYGSSRPLPGRDPVTDTTTTLEAGALRVTSPAACARSFPLGTAAATLHLGCGDGVVSAAFGGRVTRLSTHRGRVRVRSSTGESLVRAGEGRSFELQRGSHPHPLPAAPRWVQPPAERIATPGGPVDAFGSYALPRVRVAHWRVEMARDEAFREVVAARRLDGAVTRWEGRGLEPGAYYVRVSAVDRDLYEGPPSPAARVEVRGPEVQPGALGVDGARGRLATVRVPEGLVCGLDGATMLRVNQPLRLTPARGHRLRCATRPGADPYEVALSPTQAGPVGHAVDLRVTNVNEGILTLRLTDAEGAALPYVDVDVASSRGATVGLLREGEERGVYRGPFFWRGERPPAMHLRFTLNGAVTFEERADAPAPRVATW